MRSTLLLTLLIACHSSSPVVSTPTLTPTPAAVAPGPAAGAAEASVPVAVPAAEPTPTPAPAVPSAAAEPTPTPAVPHDAAAELALAYNRAILTRNAKALAALIAVPFAHEEVDSRKKPLKRPCGTSIQSVEQRKTWAACMVAEPARAGFKHEVEVDNGEDRGPGSMATDLRQAIGDPPGTTVVTVYSRRFKPYQSLRCAVAAVPDGDAAKIRGISCEYEDDSTD